MRILIIGRNGQVGSHLERELAGRHEVVALDRAGADLRDDAALRGAIQSARADAVINAAAYTAVDRAEQESDLAERCNAHAPGVMAQAAAAAGAWLVHYSTDYVFDGSARTPYDEDSPTRPLGVYGASKLRGEQAVQAAGGRHLIFRTAWVYSLHGHNFLNTMLRLGREGRELRVVDDQHGSPTWAGAIAAATARALDRLEPARSGIYHMTCGGETTWCGFAQRIFEYAGLASMQVVPITTADYPTPARRPAYSVLSNHRLRSVFGIELPHWESALRACLDAQRARS